MESVKEQYSTRYLALKQEASLTPLIFLNAAKKAYATFTRQDREIIHELTHNNIDIMSLINYWRQTYQPLITQLSQSTTKPALINRIKQDLVVDAAVAKEYIEKMLNERTLTAQNVLINEFVDTTNHDASIDATNQLRLLLNWPASDLDLFFDRYITYELYKDVSHTLGMTIYDKWRAWPVRLVQAVRERRSVKRLQRNVRKQISLLEDERGQVQQSYNGLPARMFKLNMNLVTVLAARQEYNKALDKLSQKSRASAAKRLSLYEKNTKAIRTDYVDSLPASAKLGDVQEVVKEVDSVMLEVFDMDSTARNGLMDQFKRYREITNSIKALNTKLKQ